MTGWIRERCDGAERGRTENVVAGRTGGGQRTLWRDGQGADRERCGGTDRGWIRERCDGAERGRTENAVTGRTGVGSGNVVTGRTGNAVRTLRALVNSRSLFRLPLSGTTFPLTSDTAFSLTVQNVS